MWGGVRFRLEPTEFIQGKALPWLLFISGLRPLAKELLLLLRVCVGGGLGGTRRGAPDECIKYSGRVDDR